MNAFVKIRDRNIVYNNFTHLEIYIATYVLAFYILHPGFPIQNPGFRLLRRGTNIDTDTRTGHNSIEDIYVN